MYQNDIKLVFFCLMGVGVSYVKKTTTKSCLAFTNEN